MIVPLDRSGAAPGTVSLHVERVRAKGRPKGTVLLVAGGPGQASARVFNLGSDSTAFLQAIFPGYTLVAFDPRGTGKSNLLRCRVLERGFSGEPGLEELAGCAAEIGPRRRFYTTLEHAADVDAVRAALRVQRIALWGTSYGTKLALAYSMLYPSGVERLVLDSVLPLDAPDPFGLSTLRAIPGALRSFCAGGVCRAATPRFAADVAAVANTIARRPLRGTIVHPRGWRQREELDGLDLLDLVIQADLNPGLAAELPAAVRAARLGRPAALLRVAAATRGTSVLDPRDFSPALFVSTLCGDGPFPWLPSDPAAQRREALEAALAALPPGSTGPFGPWAARFGTAEFCLPWPESGPSTLPVAPFPDVPVLLLAGDLDMRTPAADAVAVAKQFPRSHVLIVPGVGHSVLGADVSGCAERAVRTWLRGRRPPNRCQRLPPFVDPIAAIPRSLSALPAARGHAGVRGRTLTAVARTLAEVKAAFLLAVFQSEGKRSVAVAGLRGGRLVVRGSSLDMSLVRYSHVPGVTLTGRLGFAPSLTSALLIGRVEICGPKAAHGTLLVSRSGALDGELGGRRIGRDEGLRPVRPCA